ncbi:MAG TPA: hypothetical protein VEN81_12675 [Planctomycetota bacterium]|nr:hypothetical protein [Planctomycetota bacterium]
MILLDVVAPLLLCAQTQPVQEKLTEVVVVGTQHFISDMPSGYTPAHLRVLLTKINPAALAVEAPSNVKNPWDFAPLELQWVTKPWADQRRLPLIPVGWNDQFYQLKVQNMMGAFQKAGKGEEYQKLENRFQVETAADIACENFNGEKSIDLWRQYHKALHELYGKDTPWETANSKIFDNLRNALREYRGKRVAIVFGAAHGYYLIDALSQEEGVKVLPCSSFFPLSAKEVADQTTPKDHLFALRLLNFGAVAPDKLDDLGKHLEVVKSAKEYAGDYELFRGKYLLQKGDFEGARAAFGIVVGLPDDLTSAFDGTSRLNEAGAIFMALALAREGKTADALAQVEGVLKKGAHSAPMKQWAEKLQEELRPKK